MGLRCISGRHAAAPGEVRNQGFDFSRCRRCGRDMVRSGGSWRLVPAGFRVVWKPEKSSLPEISARQLLLDLPAAGRALIMRPRVTPPGMSDLIFLGLLGLRCLAMTACERIRAWGRARVAKRIARQPVIYLAPYAGPAVGVSAQ